ncbi:Uncharacterized protein LOCC1_G006169 [Lachnellula occidentalis]|uniref:RanBP2-type domain-containing protein n=1 Tax=Lachnellula occidentalis TaxID=215460 RepID=A0A8H8S0P5_9HELO|nr:Uncharacterized protein LOCC1_G006169 [Lachnellula occidentalis]
MLRDGLSASIWAPKKGDHYGPKPGDWHCVCGYSNFASRTVCNKCTAPRGNDGHHSFGHASGMIPQRQTSGHLNAANQVYVTGHAHAPVDYSWQSIHQEHPTALKSSHGNQPRTVQTSDSLAIDLLDSQKYGLATSRWAPKNYRSRRQQSDEPEIWTRTIAKPRPQTNYTSPPVSKPLDLGLPYEVQHYILAMIQRILEEGCYDFASRWVPNKLFEYKWTCPEAVELSTWKKMLPEILPPNAITHVPNTSLEKGLADAVRIRNSAVHRHLSDNVEIQRMALQAQNLMAMFSDVTRQNKLYYLQVELGEWNGLNAVDPQAARSKLQRALQEISERPLDDMDWSPNAVSLEEVGPETVSETWAIYISHLFPSPTFLNLSIMAANFLDGWNIGRKSGPVSIGSHKLWLSVRGPDRKAGQPLVIIIPGLTSSTAGWAAVQRGLLPFTRVLQYERSGYGGSDCSPSKPTATTIAKELDLLLRAANIQPPYVTVAHSWGGVLSREFLALRPQDIVGMVFVDANQERTLEVLDWRQIGLSDLMAGVDYDDATGISQAHKLTADEWRIYKDIEGTEQHRRQADLEITEYPHSFPILKAKAQLHGEKPLLGDHRVCVIKGDNRVHLERLLDAGLARGNCDDAGEIGFRQLLSTWDVKDRALQKEILLLSTEGRFIEVADSGHNVHLTEPGSIVEGVKWILSELHKQAEQ